MLSDLSRGRCAAVGVQAVELHVAVDRFAIDPGNDSISAWVRRRPGHLTKAVGHLWIGRPDGEPRYGHCRNSSNDFVLVIHDLDLKDLTVSTFVLVGLE